MQLAASNPLLFHAQELLYFVNRNTVFHKLKIYTTNRTVSFLRLLPAERDATLTVKARPLQCPGWVEVRTPILPFPPGEL